MQIACQVVMPTWQTKGRKDRALGTLELILGGEEGLLEGWREAQRK